ncbi:hypothetical protein GT354_51595 [Streptomyces sp. SID3343]|nr:hypothetical protein [Streptomyces sp. SID3343]
MRSAVGRRRLGGPRPGSSSRGRGRTGHTRSRRPTRASSGSRQRRPTRRPTPRPLPAPWRSNLQGSNLQGSNFQRSNLQAWNFQGRNFSGSNSSGSNSSAP